MAKVALVQEAPLQEEAAPAPKSKRKLFIFLILFVLLAGGGGGWYYTSQKGGAHVEKPVVEAPPIFLPIEQFTVNLNPEGGEQFLQAAFTFKVTDADVVEAVKLRLPDVRNRILLLLSSKKASELTTIEGKQKLSEEIMQATNEAIAPSFPVVKKTAEAKPKAGEPAKSASPAHTVTGVLFTHFIIQ